MLKQRQTEPLWKKWDHKAQKTGVHKTVYLVNGDEYTGEWKDNKRNGESVSRASGAVGTARNTFLYR